MAATDAQAVRAAFAPNSQKQTRFLSSSAFECLYGGRVGGGKTYGLVGDSLGMSGTWTDVDGIVGEAGLVRYSVEHPRYEGIIFRKIEDDLGEIERLCREIYSAIFPKVKYNKGEKVFHFPNGATIELGGLAKGNAHERYKSRSFQWIGWEELTEHESPEPYEYLITRVRPGNGMPNDFPCYVRATTNPDGPGQAWVKARFHIENEGGSVAPFVGHTGIVNGVEYAFHREFIAAGAEDNPDLPDNYIAQLGALSFEKQRALRFGRWDVLSIKGAIFKQQFLKIADELRVCSVPYVEGYPVNTFWDLGINDRQAIWFHQRIGREDRFIDYFEDSQKPLAHYAQALKSRDYVYGMHYLPHDGEHRKPGMYEIRSQREMLEDLKVSPIEIVPRVPSITQGIEVSRQALSAVRFDKTKCAQGLAALQAYRFAWNSKKGTTEQRPQHDWASNGADAFRQFAQGYFEGTGHVRDDNRGAPSTSRGRRGDDDYNPEDPQNTAWTEI